jgi:hypothetical protein
MFGEQITNQKRGMSRIVIMMEQQLFPTTDQAFFSSLPLSAFSSPPDNIPCSPSGHEVEIHDELRPRN